MSTRRARRASPPSISSWGFTLLEVMVSMSILALSITAIAGINANSFQSSNYAREITVATLLARSKMIDVEQELRDDGFGDSDKEYDGDFSDEGFPGFRWVAISRKVELDIGQLIGAMLGGEMDLDSAGDDMQSMVAMLRGEDVADVAGSAAGSDELSQMLNPELMATIFEQVNRQLSDSIREITLEILWGREGVDEEAVKFVQYVTSTTQHLQPPSPKVALPGGIGGKAANTLPPTLPGGIPNPALKRGAKP